MNTKEAISKKVKDVFQTEFGLDPALMKPTANLYKDLGLDSIDAIDLVVRLEVETGLKLHAMELKSIRTFQDVVDIIWKKLQNKKPSREE
jgi:acyl carrier protein